jgi:hypothetical protein
MPSPTADRTDVIRRYLAHARAHEESRPPQGPVSRWRQVGTTVALWPMLAVAALPVTFLLAAGFSIALDPFGAGPLSVAVVALVALGVAWFAARHLLSLPEPSTSQSTWRRLLALSLAIAYGWIGVAEVVTGGRFADAVLLAWLLGIAWCWSFAGQDRRRWPRRRVALWAIAPLAVVLVFALELSAGFFAVRFDAARSDLTDVARRIAAGEDVPVGTEVGSFEVGIRRNVPDCETSFVLDGWWRDDERWIAWCPAGEPTRVALGVHSLGGDWYEVDDG